MSNKDEIASGAEHGDQSTDSVYDFLYHDVRRIGSFLAQFDELGHLQQITASEMASKGTKGGFSLKLAGSAPAVPGVLDGAEGSVTIARDPSQSGSEAIARVYDPLWTNARALLDYLDERKLIQRDLTASHLGQFVIASGQLSILNATLLPRIWKMSGVRDVLVRTQAEIAMAVLNASPQGTNLRHSDRAKAEKAILKVTEANVEAGMDVIALLPHSAQCTIKGADYSVWSSLSAEGMVGTVADLSLKHGTEIPGEWHLLGVLDALPNPIPAQVLTPNTGAPGHMGTFIKNLSNLARKILGRAPEEYGVTALLLFREVSVRSH